MLLTASGLFVFLAYGTTSVVARQLGAGSRSGALEVGGGGVWLAESWLHVNPGLNSNRDRARVGLYAATGLPIIVAVTDVAVGGDLMRAEEAAVLVAAGAATVLLFPLLAELINAPGSDTSCDSGPGSEAGPGNSEQDSDGNGGNGDAAEIRN